MILYACLKLTGNHDLAVLVSLALLLAIWPVFDSCKIQIHLNSPCCVLKLYMATIC